MYKTTVTTMYKHNTNKKEKKLRALRAKTSEEQKHKLQGTLRERERERENPKENVLYIL
jgi:hypothetical protein